MHIKLIPSDCVLPSSGSAYPLLHQMLENDLLGSILLDSLTSKADRCSPVITAIPSDYQRCCFDTVNTMHFYDSTHPSMTLDFTKDDEWLLISNARFDANIDFSILLKIFEKANANILAITGGNLLLPGSQQVRLTSAEKLAGIRHLYSDLICPVPISSDWPHYLIIKSSCARMLDRDNTIPLVFKDFIKLCDSKGMKTRNFKIGINSVDLNSEAGMLKSVSSFLTSNRCRFYMDDNRFFRKSLKAKGISDKAKLFGLIISGDNVEVDDGAVITGPTILCDNVKISESAIVRNSFIGPGEIVPKSRTLTNRIVLNDPPSNLKHSRTVLNLSGVILSPKSEFRLWSALSYIRLLKRIVDIFCSLLILILFAPIFPLIALAIKLNSPGPIFFKDRRQGLHGRPFNCLKFRTMIAGADLIQAKLRFKNQVDGPQFKMDNDPRVTAIGRFLRETYLDEIPQFINVLLGHMSMVGPRPSPDAENSLCPFWHDARLSVRPGITGLWQVYRTRQPGRDFQEWIYHDTSYVHEASLMLDLSICWQTARKLISNFFSQF